MARRKKLIVKWQRLLFDGQTCPRCGATEAEVEKALLVLNQALSPVDIDVILEKGELSVDEFKKDTLQSNKICLNGRLLEEWLDGRTGQSRCCDVCGPHDCRTVGLEEEVYETVPSKLIVKAGLLAASQLLGPQSAKNVPEKSRPKNHCCPK